MRPRRLYLIIFSFLIFPLLFGLQFADAQKRTSSRGSARRGPVKADANTATNDGSTASLRETLDWLKEEVANHGSLSHTENGTTNTYVVTPVSFKGCSIEYKEAWGGDPTQENTVVPLGDLDPLTVSPSEDSTYSGAWSISFETSKGKKSIKALSSKELMDNNSFIVDDEKIAKRIVKALQHAITLCGGKIDPF